MADTSILALAVSGAGLILSASQYFYNRRRDASGQIGDLANEIVELRERLSRQEATGEMTWKIMEMYAGKALHKDDNEFGVDYYLDKPNLDKDEAQALVYRLHEISVDKNLPDGTRMAAMVKLAGVVRRYSEYKLIVPEVK